MQETLLPGKMGKMRGHARDQDEEETRKEMQAREVWAERGRAARPASVPPSPPRGINPDSCPPLPWEDSVASEVPAPFLTRVGHPDTWVPCSRYREEREEKPGQRVKFQNVL